MPNAQNQQQQSNQQRPDQSKSQQKATDFGARDPEKKNYDTSLKGRNPAELDDEEDEQQR